MKDSKTLTDIDKLKEIYSKIDGNRRIYAEKMLEQLEFMSETLSELQRQVREDGPITSQISGNGFELVKENPAQASYNQMFKNYNATIKTLTDMLPKDDHTKDDLIDFLGGGSE